MFWIDVTRQEFAAGDRTQSQRGKVAVGHDLDQPGWTLLFREHGSTLELKAGSEHIDQVAPRSQRHMSERAIRTQVREKARVEGAARGCVAEVCFQVHP